MKMILGTTSTTFYNACQNLENIIGFWYFEKGDIFQNRVLWRYFSSSGTCVNEKSLCKGKRLCANGNDLKWCKNATSLTIPPGWKPLYGHVNCNYINSNVTGQEGQWVKKEGKYDTTTFNCFNRKDENPFIKTTNHNENVQKEGDAWLDAVRKPCPYGKDYRRCLGNRPDLCIGKFLVNSF